MTQIKTHIFSFDRPAQLHLLLDSILKYDKSNDLAVYVQFGCSNPDYEKGYDLLKKKFKEIKFIQENIYHSYKINNFFSGNLLFNTLLWIKNWRYRFSKSNFRDILIDSLSDRRYEYFMFLTDDSLFYDNIFITQDALQQLKTKRFSAYSLASGINISGAKYIQEEKYITWKVNQQTNNLSWCYPFSVDGRVYIREELLSLSKKVIFSNPNTYETVMVLYHRYFNVFNNLVANYKSCLIGFELNRVQQIYQNNNLNIDQRKMNEYYLQGYFLSIDFDRSQINSFRPEIHNLIMVKDEIEVNLM